MNAFHLGPRGWRWTPDRLGNSLPIARGLGLSRAVAALLFLLGILHLGLFWRARLHPDVEPLSAAQARKEVTERLASVTIEPWRPGTELSPSELPPLAPAAPLELWPGRHPGDPEVVDPRVEEARTRFEEGRYAAAATLWGRLADANSRSWALRYAQGISLLRAASFDREAGETLSRARALLKSYEGRFAADPAHHAAVIANRYAEGLAALDDDCVLAIRHLKLGVRSLRSFVDVEGVDHTNDRRLPFRVAPMRLDNYDVWNALSAAYFVCEGRYPEEYFQRWSGGRSYKDFANADPALTEVKEGPFAKELAACWSDEGKSSRCWGMLNLNMIYHAVGPWYPADGAAPSADAREHLPSMARLAFNVARIAAQGEDRDGALRQLQQAALLDRVEPAIGLSGPIRELGRYLAAETGNYEALAEPYRGRSLSSLPFDDDPSPEALKGMAWALSERWQEHIAEGRPEAFAQEVTAALQDVPGPYLASLGEYQRGAQREMQKTLAKEIKVEKRNPAIALALRDYRADYLGEGWPDRAQDAWVGAGIWARLIGLGLFYLLLLAAWWAAHRFVVYPYLLYNSNYYQTEFQHRYAVSRKADKPFTGREIHARRRDRDRV